MAVADDGPTPSDLESREPTLEDLRDLCRALNERGEKDIIAVDALPLRHRRFAARDADPLQRHHFALAGSQ